MHCLKIAGHDFRVDLVGDGPLRTDLKRSVYEAKLEQQFSISGRSNRIPEILEQSTLLAHTSDVEGCPNVVMEAMACGRPVVATDAGDIPTLVEDGKTGFVVRRGDDGELVRKLATLIQNRELCQTMGCNAREKAENEFGVDRLVRETFAAYRAAGWIGFLTMCGIAGWFGRAPGDVEAASKLASALKHRGPDSHGIRSWAEATLVHTRLSIIDLSPAGHQPMANEDGTVWTVFNGEIYNHRELRIRLEARGHVFNGHCDTEVLTHLYEEEGIQFLPKLRGMFAFAIYDTRAKILLLARDRFGIKPLFYAPQERRIAFASEINALRTLPEIDQSPDRQAVYDYAALSISPRRKHFIEG